MNFCGSAISVSALILSMSVNAVAASLLNGSFEDGDGKPPIDNIHTMLGGTNDIDWWTVTTDSVDWVGNEFWEASDGLWSLDLSGSHAGAISQTFDTVIGQQYRVAFDMAANPDESEDTIKSFQVSAANTTSSYTVDPTGYSRQSMGWTEGLFLFSAINTSTTLTFTSSTEGVYGAALDNVRVNAVPIPAAVWLFGSGLIGLVGFARKK